MIFLLTGEPFAGKSTVARKFVERFTGTCQWVVADEVTDADGERVGYEAVDSTGRHHLLAHQAAIKSNTVIGSRRYYVDPSAIDQMYTKPLQAALHYPPECLVIDEIGNMQRLSPNFTKAIDATFEHNVPMLATIRTRDEWTAGYIYHPNAYPLSVTPATRDQLPDVLLHVFTALPLCNALPPAQVRVVHALSHKYCEGGHLMQLDKLFGKALRYVIDERVSEVGQGVFSVIGDHDNHTVSIQPTPHCDCPLFTGRGKYNGRPGDCSHLMATWLFKRCL
ncbi:MAG TPA: nucleoside-triphosphatase [Verrucomicrobiae bacterium]|nr:nucleoside-triphosphatase [Verrucomicrobiae bacterium]